jgi:hypothetical protein
LSSSGLTPFHVMGEARNEPAKEPEEIVERREEMRKDD